MNRHLLEMLAKHGLLNFNQDPAPSGGDPAEPADPKPAEPSAQETDWKAEARKWESRAKENSDAAARLAEIEEANKTEAQKRDDALAEALAKVKEYEDRDQRAEWAKEIVKDSKVPADTLRGSTREELEQHFQQIQSLMPKEDAPKKGAVAPYVAGEGKSASRQPTDSEPSPGRGRMRAAYAEAASK